MACHSPFTVILFEFLSLSVSLYISAEPIYHKPDIQIKGNRTFFICNCLSVPYAIQRSGAVPHRLPAITPTIVSTTLATSASSNRNSFAIPSTSFRSISTAINIHFNMVSSTVAAFLKTIPTIDISPILYRNPYIVLVLPFNRILHNAFMPADIKDYHISNELVYGFHISVFSSANTKCTFRRCLLSSLRHNTAQSCIIRHWCDPTCNSGTHKILSR